MKTIDQIDSQWKVFFNEYIENLELTNKEKIAIKQEFAREVNSIVTLKKPLTETVQKRLNKLTTLSTQDDFLKLDPYGVHRISFFNWCIS